MKYIVISHNDGATGTLFALTVCPTVEMAREEMKADFMYCLENAGLTLDGVENDLVMSDDDIYVEIYGVIYEWAVRPIKY